MATQLHEAVRLAQAGQRDDARRLLRQITQTDPNNEMAWLWLASVAADQIEYEHALTEVLRVNPTNRQARDLLAEFRQQQARPAYAAPSQTPPPVARQRPVTPPPGVQAPPAQYAPQPAYTPTPAPAPAPARRRGCLPGCMPGCGCGCVPSCLIVLVLFVLLPVGACLGLSFTNMSHGPIDVATGYLPDDLGRKAVSYTYTPEGASTVYRVTATVPRSWFVASDTQSDWWPLAVDVLDEALPLEDATLSWQDFSDPDRPPLLDVDPIQLSEAGSVIGGGIENIVERGRLGINDFSCDALQAIDANRPDFLPAGDLTFVTGSQGRCIARLDRVTDGPTTRVFANSVPPSQIHETFVLQPIDDDRAALWRFTIPQSAYDTYADDLDRFVETAEIEQE